MDASPSLQVVHDDAPAAKIGQHYNLYKNYLIWNIFLLRNVYNHYLMLNPLVKISPQDNNHHRSQFVSLEYNPEDNLYITYHNQLNTFLRTIFTGDCP